MIKYKEFPCPSCGAMLRIDADKPFKAGVCPSCNNRITIPAKSQSKGKNKRGSQS